jgi:hypothetical protein
MIPDRRAGFLACVLAIATPAWAESMRECVERGGVYLDDGTCESGDDEAAKRCRRQGGRWSSGRCDMPKVDPEEECRNAGGVGMHDGKCWRLRTRD